MNKSFIIFSFLYILGNCAIGQSHKECGMILIHAKKQSFIMGLDTSTLFKNEPKQGWANYVGRHNVSFTYNFYMDTTLVTQKDYFQLMGNNPSGNNNGDLNLPVEQVSWYDAVLYCNARSKRDGFDTVYHYTAIERNGNSVKNIVGLSFDIKKNGYRLPTNAEYEYAERANTSGKYFFTNDETSVESLGTDYAWSTGFSGFTREKGGIFSKPVGTKKPNPWGLYDIIGNVFEWCNDWDAPYPLTDEIDPIGQSIGKESKKVAKGGSYRTDIVYHMRIAYHFKWPPQSAIGEIGFRCVRTEN